MKALTEYLLENARAEEQTQIRKLEKERRARVLKEKKEMRCRFVVGELVCKYFPNLLILDQVELSTEAVPELDKLERILDYLFDHPELLDEILNETNMDDKGK